MKTRKDYLEKIEHLLTRYLHEIEISNLKPLSMHTYQKQAVNFVRWIKDEFKPGKKPRTKDLEE